MPIYISSCSSLHTNNNYSMPPSSRKRNKGKERKAKQLTKQQFKEVNCFWRRLESRFICGHGRALSISDDHPISSFMDQLCMNLQHKGMTASQTLTNLFETHRHIWNNESYRKIVLDILVRIGTNLLLVFNNDFDEGDHTWTVCIAMSVVLLEHYDGTDDIDSIINKRVVLTKWRDLEGKASSGRRDCLKFFRKRITCKCLKKMHLEARRLPKMGICWHCKVEKERVALSVCSRCMLDQYCSRECQVADWSIHESRCDIYVKANREGDKMNDEKSM